jgi:hypothetical protein
MEENTKCRLYSMLANLRQVLLVTTKEPVPVFSLPPPPKKRKKGRGDDDAVVNVQ